MKCQPPKGTLDLDRTPDRQRPQDVLEGGVAHPRGDHDRVLERSAGDRKAPRVALGIGPRWIDQIHVDELAGLKRPSRRLGKPEGVPAATSCRLSSFAVNTDQAGSVGEAAVTWVVIVAFRRKKRPGRVPRRSPYVSLASSRLRVLRLVTRRQRCLPRPGAAQMASSVRARTRDTPSNRSHSNLDRLGDLGKRAVPA